MAEQFANDNPIIREIIAELDASTVERFFSALHAAFNSPADLANILANCMPPGTNIPDFTSMSPAERYRSFRDIVWFRLPDLWYKITQRSP